jgi:UDP-N-acetylmuramate dehydrogenase
VPTTLFEIFNTTLRGRVAAAEPLSRHTTWRVGGPADLFLVPADREDLLAALGLLRDREIPWLAIGAGSNLLVRDGGFRGAVIHTSSLRGVAFSAGPEVRAEGGAPLTGLIRRAAARGLGGLEALAGIPGTLGGAVAMNAGAGGQEMADALISVTVAGAGGEESLAADALGFGYRRSNLPEQRVVVEARLRFQPEKPALLEEEIRRCLLHRREAQGVGAPNAGSVFKNPPGVTAWRLIAGAGLSGASVGGAALSEKHANFIVNRGGATASDILGLITRIKDAVQRQRGIELETEVRIVGED